MMLISRGAVEMVQSILRDEARWECHYFLGDLLFLEGRDQFLGSSIFYFRKAEISWDARHSGEKAPKSSGQSIQIRRKIHGQISVGL